MHLTPEEINGMSNFLGYGNLNAPYWFLGMEEGTGGATTAEIEKNMKIHATFSPVIDVYEAHLLYDYDMTIQNKFTPVWLQMAYIVRAMKGNADWEDINQAKEYVRFKLGRKDNETFLTELMPLPSPSLAHWPYESVYPTRRQYEAEVLPQRQQLLRALIAEHKPRYLFAYGARNREHYKGIVEEMHWTSLNTANLIEVGQTTHTTVVIMPFFGNGALKRSDVRIMIEYLRNNHP